jgi:hypothetical protein
MLTLQGIVELHLVRFVVKQEAAFGVTIAFKYEASNQHQSQYNGFDHHPLDDQHGSFATEGIICGHMYYHLTLVYAELLITYFSFVEIWQGNYIVITMNIPVNMNIKVAS